MRSCYSTRCMCQSWTSAIGPATSWARRPGGEEQVEACSRMRHTSKYGVAAWTWCIQVDCDALPTTLYLMLHEPALDSGSATSCASCISLALVCGPHAVLGAALEAPCNTGISTSASTSVNCQSLVRISSDGGPRLVAAAIRVLWSPSKAVSQRYRYHPQARAGEMMSPR